LFPFPLFEQLVFGERPKVDNILLTLEFFSHQKHGVGAFCGQKWHVFGGLKLFQNRPIRSMELGFGGTGCVGQNSKQ
jgi:hypothetical protein